MTETAALLGVLFTLIAVSSVLGSDGGQIFPHIEGKALTGEKFQVPGSLAGSHNLILVAFLREQQEEIDTWIARADSLERAVEGFTFYEFPVLPEMNAVTRWFIYRGMRSGITSDRARERTVTFHLDKEEFKRHLAIESEKYISVFLVNSGGALLWRTSGKWSQEKQDALDKVLDVR